MKKFKFIILLSALFIGMPARADSTDKEIRDISKYFGNNRAQARKSIEIIDRQEITIREISRNNKIAYNAIRRAAIILRAKNPDVSVARFIRLVEGAARSLSEAQAATANLEALVGKIDDKGLRRRAIFALDRAVKAFNAGKLDEAEAAFAELSFLRQYDFSGTSAMWVEAVHAEANIAASLGDNARANKIYNDALGISNDQNLRTNLALQLANAKQWYEGGLVAEKYSDKFDQSIAIYRDKIMPLISPSLYPEEWAKAHNELGVVLSQYGSNRGDSKKLSEAIELFLIALEVRKSGLNRGISLNNLGNALSASAELDGAMGRSSDQNDKLASASEKYREALLYFDKSVEKLRWAAAMDNLGVALKLIGTIKSDINILLESEMIHLKALEELDKDKNSLQWAGVQNNLGELMRIMANITGDDSYRLKSVEALMLSLQKLSRDRGPFAWSTVKSNVGNLLINIGKSEVKVNKREAIERFEESVESHRAALEVRTYEFNKIYWAQSRANLANALSALAENLDDSTRFIPLFEEAIAAHRDASKVLTQNDFATLWPIIQNNLGLTLKEFGKRRRSKALLEEAVTAMTEASRAWKEQGKKAEQEKAEQQIEDVLQIIKMFGL